MIKKNIVPVAAGFILLLIFYKWFFPGVLSGGDWPYLFPQSVKEVTPLSAWDNFLNNGMGISNISRIWFDSYALSVLKIAKLIPWSLFERIVWYFPYVLLSFFSAFFLAKKINLSRDLSLVSGVIFSINTYSILIVAGGQVGVMMAYAFLPLLFLALINLVDKFTFRNSLLLSLTLGILIVLDLRVAYMYLVSEFLFAIVYLTHERRDLIKKFLYAFAVPGLTAGLLHSFWILPVILMHRNPAGDVPQIFTSAASLDFFSFAKFENSIAFLHPNWPDNIFGKTSFLAPEFLLLSLIAYGGLLFLKRDKKNHPFHIYFFALLGLSGAFLAKGTNEPFGQIYRTLFNFLPGFNLFRDPTKWYMLTAISYCVLIPVSIHKIGEQFKNNTMFKSKLPYLPVLFLIFWLFLLRPLIFGQKIGTLSPHDLPPNYIELSNILTSDKQFSRTLWIPQFPTVAYNSPTHPAIAGVDFFEATSIKNLTDILNKKMSEKILEDSSVKYIIVPDDVYGKIFLNDRKYDDKLYSKTLSRVKKISYLENVANLGKIAVFKLKDPKGHFYGSSQSLSVSFRSVSPTNYEVLVNNVKKGDSIYFSETYDNFWIAKTQDNLIIQSYMYKISNLQRINGFKLPKSGSYGIEIYYKPQEWLNLGFVISGICLVTVLYMILRLREGKFKKSK